MLRGGASMAIASIWTSMANWSTPTILFCALNLMIVIIFIASNSRSPLHHRNNLPNQLARSPSLLERVKSVNLSSFYGITDSHDHYRDQYKTTERNSVTQLNRRPSLSHHHESEQTHYDSPSQLTRVPSLLERVKSIKLSTEPEQLNIMGEPEPTRVPSLLGRIKSFKLNPSFNSDHHSGDICSTHDQHSDMDLAPHHDSVQDNDGIKNFYDGSSTVTGGKSEKSSETPVNKSPTNLTKSHRKKRVAESNNRDVDIDDQQGAAAMKAALIGGRNESVDAKADDFIKRFKQQLKLQRIDSLQRFREMLNRGTYSG